MQSSLIRHPGLARIRAATWRLCDDLRDVVEEIHVEGEPLGAAVHKLEDIAGVLQSVAGDLESLRRPPLDSEATQAAAIVLSGRLPEAPDAIALGILFEGTDVSHICEKWQAAEMARAVAWLVMTNKRAMRILRDLGALDDGERGQSSFLDRAMAREG